MKAKILIVEDEPEIVTLICNRLDKNLYDIVVARHGQEGLKQIQGNHFDLVSLDIMLPSVDGFSLCQEVRKRDKNTLICIISALDREEDKEKAYILGADDYISKPFSPKLVALKMATLLKRRFELTHAHVDAYAILRLDEDLKRFHIQEDILPLTLSEYTILEVLFKTPKKIFSKADLSQILYDEGIGNIDEKGITTHIYMIRKKISLFHPEEIIKTSRGIGYTLS